LSHVDNVDDADVTDVNTEHPDKKSIMMYVMCCYEALTAEKKPNNNVRIFGTKLLNCKRFVTDLNC